jgi:hypothetical protein|tara:strand:- start:2589 stop:2792 length:204 start_codon:yes stop_codon:yes gene_type:complete
MREELYLRQLKVLHRVVKNVRKKYQGDASGTIKPVVDDLNRIALEIHTLQQDIEINLDKNDRCQCGE